MPDSIRAIGIRTDRDVLVHDLGRAGAVTEDGLRDFHSGCQLFYAGLLAGPAASPWELNAAAVNG